MIHNKTLDKSVPIPLYYQLKSIICEEIEGGSYPVGSMIPTEKELSEIFTISRTTVRQAISELVQEGLLYRVKSKGTFVTRPKINQDFIKKLGTFNEQIRDAGRVPSTQLLEMKVVPMPEDLAEGLDLKPGDKAIYLYRLRSADDEPIVTVKTYLPYDKSAFAMEHDFAQESLYEVLAANDETRICKVSRIVEAVAAGSNDARMLGIKRGKPIHYFVTTGYNANGEPIELSFARYRGDQNRFQVDVYVDTGEGTAN